MIRKSTWIFLGLFGLVLLLAWGFQTYKTRQAANVTPTAGAELSEPLLEVQASALVSIRVENDQGQFLVLGKNIDGQWVVLDPQSEVLTDAAKVEAAVSQLLALSAQFSLDMPDNLQEYGLINPTHVITLTLTGGETILLRVGSQAPAVSGYYVQLNDGAPKVVSKFNLDTLLDMIQNPPYLPTVTPTLFLDENGTPVLDESGTPLPESSETPEPATETVVPAATDTAAPTATP